MNVSHDYTYNINLIGEFTGYYLIPISGIFSFISNVRFAYLLIKHRKLMKQRKYRILLIKSSFTSIIVIGAIGFQNSHCTFCSERINNSYIYLVYSVVSRIVGVVFVNTIWMLEITINFERYTLLHERNNFNIPLKYLRN